MVCDGVIRVSRDNESRAWVRERYHTRSLEQSLVQTASTLWCPLGRACCHGTDIAVDVVASFGVDDLPLGAITRLLDELMGRPDARCLPRSGSCTLTAPAASCAFTVVTHDTTREISALAALQAAYDEVLPEAQRQLQLGDELIDLGIGSIAALEIAASLQVRWGVEIPDSDLFELRTVADFAELLQRKRAQR